jgi:hypothetical protein
MASRKDRRAEVLEFAANAAQGRATHYREHASQLRKMAETETPGRLRNGILKLAEQYEGLAATVEIKP